MSKNKLGYASHVHCVDEAAVGTGPQAQALLPFAAQSLATMSTMVPCWLSVTGPKQLCKQKWSVVMPLGREEFIKGHCEEP